MIQHKHWKLEIASEIYNEVNKFRYLALTSKTTAVDFDKNLETDTKVVNMSENTKKNLESKYLMK
ncbi:hypothetical protein CWI36_2027p0010 [Hamiltosporidium magnivora]|uniref:Uncharacterized protein n=1 Tax=Hamiltosporidium magnivora TaxID=148818 RepID=A0A4Q9KY17_9MICR|nr:hypothetical protein CWI36_2027p0010 [Hamiltosporidium magnivora]